MTANKGPNGENFYMCNCQIKSLKGINVCSLIVKSPTPVKFGYLLTAWNYA